MAADTAPVRSFPEGWPPSLARAFERVEAIQTRVTFTLADGFSTSGYATFDELGRPALGRTPLNGLFSRVVTMKSMPSVIRSATMASGVRTVYWSLERDEPVLWVMGQ